MQNDSGLHSTLSIALPGGRGTVMAVSMSSSSAGQRDGAGQRQGYEIEHHHAVDDEECFHYA